MTTKYQENLKQVLLLNEANAKEAYKINYAQKGNSGWSFGYQQMDLGSNPQARIVMKDIYDHRFGEGAYNEIKNQIEVQKNGLSLSSREQEKINTALSSDYGKQQIDKQFSQTLYDTEVYVNKLESKLEVNFTFEAKVSIGDIFNQFGKFDSNGSAEKFLKNAAQDGVVDLNDVTNLRKTFLWYKKDPNDSDRRINNIEKVLLQEKSQPLTLLDSHGNPLLLAYNDDGTMTDAGGGLYGLLSGDNSNITQNQYHNSSSDIILSSLSSDLYSIHQKLFSVENLAYAASQLAMGADINDVARFVVVNTIATSAVDSGLKVALLREEFADKSLDGLNDSYNQLLSDNTGLASMRAGFTVFVASAVLSHGFFALEKQRIAVFSKKRQQGACDAVAGTSRLVAKRTKAAKCVEATSDYFC